MPNTPPVTRARSVSRWPASDFSPSRPRACCSGSMASRTAARRRKRTTPPPSGWAPGEAVKKFPPAKVSALQIIVSTSLKDACSGNTNGAHAAAQSLRDDLWDADQASSQPLDNTGRTSIDSQMDKVLGISITRIRRCRPPPAPRQETLRPLARRDLVLAALRRGFCRICALGRPEHPSALPVLPQVSGRSSGAFQPAHRGVDAGVEPTQRRQQRQGLSRNLACMARNCWSGLGYRWDEMEEGGISTPLPREGSSAPKRRLTRGKPRVRRLLSCR